MIALLLVIGVTTEESVYLFISKLFYYHNRLKMTSFGIFLALKNYVASGNRKTRRYLAKRAFLQYILDFVRLLIRY